MRFGEGENGVPISGDNWFIPRIQCKRIGFLAVFASIEHLKKQIPLKIVRVLAI
jgi:hypothetical protein